MSLGDGMKVVFTGALKESVGLMGRWDAFGVRLTQTPVPPWKVPVAGSTWGASGPWICWAQNPVPAPVQGQPWVGRASAAAPGGRGAARERASVCVRSAGLLSPACADATLFLFPIFTADFSFTRASASAAPQFLLTEAFRLSILSLFSPLTLFLFLCSRD